MRSFVLGLLAAAIISSPCAAATRASSDAIVARLQNGDGVEWGDILELGRRGDPKVRPFLVGIGEKYVSELRRRIRKVSPESEAVNEESFRDIEVPIELYAKKAAARLGEKKYFDYFVAGLSSKDDEYRLDCIETLKYIGDRAAIKHLIPLLEDSRIPVGKEGRILDGSPPFSGYAALALAEFIPKGEVPPALKGFYEADKWRPAIKQWWKSNKGKYGRLEFGKEKIFEVPVVQ